MEQKNEVAVEDQKTEATKGQPVVVEYLKQETRKTKEGELTFTFEVNGSLRFKIYRDVKGELSGGEPWDQITGKSLGKWDLPAYREVYRKAYAVSAMQAKDILKPRPNVRMKIRKPVSKDQLSLGV